MFTGRATSPRIAEFFFPTTVTVPLELPETAVTVAALVLGALLVSVASLTVGRSVYRAWRQRRRDAVREPLRDGLLERLYGPGDPQWQQWVDSLSRRERSVLESLLDEYLRELDGKDASTLAGLGAALGIDERAHRLVREGDRYERLRALTWLALLRDPPDISVLRQHCTGTPRERAAATRVLYQAGHPDIASLGVALLLYESTEPFSVFGIDTLYRVAEADPTDLFAHADATAGTWDPALRQQVLLVCRYLNTVVGAAELTWVVEALTAPEERTRVEAARALGGFGWRQSLREDVDTTALCTDPSPKVRASAYRMLGEWGDAAAVETLVVQAATEPEPHARVAAAEALVDHRDSHAFSVPESLADAWAWVVAHDTFDQLAADVSPNQTRTRTDGSP